MADRYRRIRKFIEEVDFPESPNLPQGCVRGFSEIEADMIVNELNTLATENDTLQARVQELEAELEHDAEVHETFANHVRDALMRHAMKFYNPHKRNPDKPTIYHHLGDYITELEETIESLTLDGTDESTAPNAHAGVVEAYHGITEPIDDTVLDALASVQPLDSEQRCGYCGKELENAETCWQQFGAPCESEIYEQELYANDQYLFEQDWLAHMEEQRRNGEID